MGIKPKTYYIIHEMCELRNHFWTLWTNLRSFNFVQQGGSLAVRMIIRKREGRRRVKAGIQTPDLRGPEAERK